MNFWEFSNIDNHRQKSLSKQHAGNRSEFIDKHNKYESLPEKDKRVFLKLQQVKDSLKEAEGYFISNDSISIFQKLNNKIQEIQSNLDEIKAVNPELDELEYTSNDLQELLSMVQGQLEENVSILNFYNQTKEELKQTQLEYDRLPEYSRKIYKEYLASKEFTKTVFTNDGKLKYLNSHLNNVLAMLFVTRRSPNECAVLQQIRVTKEYGVLVGRWGAGYQEDEMSDTYLRNKKCPGKRYMFAYVYYDADADDDGTPDTYINGVVAAKNHANALIIDTLDNKFLILDPHGKSSFIEYQNKLRERVRANFPGIVEHDFSICPIFGPQTRLTYTNIHGDGICWLYSLYMIDTVISNKLSLDTEDLNLIEDSFIEFFIEFDQFRQNYIKNSKILSDLEKEHILDNKDLDIDNMLESILQKIWNDESQKNI